MGGDPVQPQVRYDDLAFYQSLGMKCGIEMHRQLGTERKLFCQCPILPYSSAYDAEILRHMRPTLSEMGEYDPTALMEFKTKKEIVYRLNRDTVCTYEMDDAPPFGLNRDALARALRLSVMLNLGLVDELHIARKQYLDGSIPTGFQRTTILGVDGYIVVDGKRIGIRQLGLEEDACREVSDRGHRRTYMTDRLSIPLIEIVTEAEAYTPHEAARMGAVIRRLCHLSGVVRTGHGRARQDVNVSIAGGTRIEIKGVSSLRQIPALVHYEALRQKALLEIREATQARGITPESFQDTVDVTDVARGLNHPAFRRPWGAGIVARAIVLRNCGGLLGWPTGPGRTLGHEVADWVRVIACLDRLPNLVHTDDQSCFELMPLFDEVRRRTKAGAADAIVVVPGSAGDVETALKEIRNRMLAALEGVPRETRRSLRSGATCFERLLPGADRMYPDTDLPPIVLTEEDFERARAGCPEALWDLEARFQAMGLSRQQVERLFTEDGFRTFQAAVDRVRVKPSILAWLLLDFVPHLGRAGADAARVDADFLASLLGGDDAALLCQKDVAARVGIALGTPPRWVAKPDPRKAKAPVAQAEVLG